MALDLLRAALQAEPAVPALEEVVARIQSAGPSPTGLRLARGALADALLDGEDDVLDMAAWRQAWSAVEAELAAIADADDQAEG